MKSSASTQPNSMKVSIGVTADVESAPTRCTISSVIRTTGAAHPTMPPRIVKPTAKT